MRYDPSRHHRRSIRLRGYDYAQAGLYFVTICAQDWGCLFGTAMDSTVQLSAAGRMIQATWEALPRHYRGVDLDAFVVMPNHVHGIVVLVGDQVTISEPLSLGAVMQRFKSLTTTEYRRGVVEHGWPSFPGRLWQRNYYEHVIRNEQSLQKIREYIATNPARWAEDQLHPHQPSKW